MLRLFSGHLWYDTIDLHARRVGLHDETYHTCHRMDAGWESNPMVVTKPETVHADWVQTVLFERGYLARIRGDAIKVYLTIIEACNGVPDRSLTISLNQLMERTHLSCPTVIESLSRLRSLVWLYQRLMSVAK